MRGMNGLGMLLAQALESLLRVGDGSLIHNNVLRGITMHGLRLYGAAMSMMLLAPGFALASSASEMFRTEAMFLLSDKDYAGAIEKLDQAVQADASDIHARYYRGIAFSRSGQYAEAVGDLSMARQGGLAYPDLLFELGYAQYRQKQFAGADANLSQAARQRPRHAASHYYLGLVRYKQKRYADALEPLATAARLNASFAASSTYLRAEALARLQRPGEAEKLLVAGLQAYPDSIYTGPMKELQAKLAKARKSRRWVTMNLGLGFAYDDNVGLFADETALPPDIDSGEDFRTSFSAGAGVSLQPAKDLKLAAGYSIFQSRHQDLAQYDVISQGPYLSLRKDLTNAIGLTVNYAFRSSLLDNESYTDAHTLSPALAWRHGKERFSSIRGRWRDIEYLQPGQDARTGRYAELAYSHYWLTGSGAYHYLGLKLARDDTRDPDFDYQSAGLEAGIQRIYSGWKLKGRFSAEDKQYDRTAIGREDRHFQTDLNAVYPLGKKLELDIGLTHIQHPSSDINYDYTRTVVTTAVRWKL